MSLQIPVLDDRGEADRRESLAGFGVERLAAALSEWGVGGAQAPRILSRYHRAGGPADFDAGDVGAKVREVLAARTVARETRVARRHVSGDGTVKLLVGLRDGRSVEAVLMPTGRADRLAACVSSQVGCAMGCGFCATAQAGLGRNLSAAEIVEQFLWLRDEAAARGVRLATLVFMGMGEPMHNVDAVIAAVRIMAGRGLGNFGYRPIMISTVGLVPGIERLAGEGMKVTLALSLHAADDETRSAIVPMNRKWNVAAVMEAAVRYAATTGTIVNVEYCLLAGVNDSAEHARRLGELLAGKGMHLNLIPHNPIAIGGPRAHAGGAYERPGAEAVKGFLSRMRAAGIVTHVRVQRGDDIAAACGQLAGVGG